ncbi:MAG: hypothetical protein RIM84_12100 [Alphaproteobacteria bacterium]
MAPALSGTWSPASWPAQKQFCVLASSRRKRRRRRSSAGDGGDTSAGALSTFSGGAGGQPRSRSRVTSRATKPRSKDGVVELAGYRAAADAYRARIEALRTSVE